jgi:DNA repair protein RadA/Sms
MEVFVSNTITNLPPALSQKLAELGRSKARPLSLRDNNWLIDSVGCFVVGASYLLGGAPGSRKSGLATQIALDIARQGHRVLYVPTEEPADRVLERVIKMMDGFNAADITSALSNLFIERNPPSVEQLPNYVSSQVLAPSGSYHGIALAVLDSVQGHGLVSAATRAYDRVLEAARLLSSANVTSLLVNHLTKRNELAGPRTLEHGVDCVLMLRKTPSCRLLFTLKNRHGPASLRDPVALVLDPITLRLVPTPLSSAIHAAAKTYVGAGAGGAIDVQASVALAGYGTRGKVLAPGLPKAELQQLVATIGQLPGIEIDDLDFSIHCRLPGRRRYTSSVGLALAMSLLSSYLRRPIPSTCLFLGEVDLGRGIRPVDDRLLNELIAEIAAGDVMSGNWRIYCHPETAAALAGSGVTPIACEKLETVMYGVWPELR